MARRLFVEHGFHATGIAAIARESGVAVQQLYRDFPSKNHIIAAIVQVDCKQVANLPALDVALDAHDKQGIEGWLSDCVHTHDDESDRLFVQMVAEAVRNPDVGHAIRTAKDGVIRGVARAFAGLGGADAVSDRHLALARVFSTFFMGLVSMRVVNGETHEEEADFIKDLIVELAYALATKSCSGTFTSVAPDFDTDELAVGSGCCAHAPATAPDKVAQVQDS
ncbi:TetR/AcrR family transcriptional regulator [Sphingomonas gellani]|uniref:TetR/AcrR family transcriptional regulator n=1 Tax=Sphingomonas gellani TaxID=1166340 RepID=UPI001FCD62F3|nr:TetR/AcrR family transcriptional regulator [Sphingomonas gellani]